MLALIAGALIALIVTLVFARIRTKERDSSTLTAYVVIDLIFLLVGLFMTNGLLVGYFGAMTFFDLSRAKAQKARENA